MSAEKLIKLRSDFLKKINTHYPDALPALKAGLATIAVNSFKGAAQPVSLIYSGPSGSGKTLTLSLIYSDELEGRIHRADNFTPRSFVSHCATVSAEKLCDVDLLPRIENKCLLTKELAPIFRGRKEELTQTFSILISILDGRGFVSQSGVHGRRGYDRPIMLTWLGATTPLSKDVFKLMAQLGTRMMFYNTARRERSVDELLAFARGSRNVQTEDECRTSVRVFLLEFFKQYPAKSFDESTIGFDDDLLRQLCVYAKLMAKLRATHEGDEMSGATTFFKECEERAIIILKNIALGHALMHQRSFVNAEDLAQIRHIAFSSCYDTRRAFIKAVIESGGVATTQDLIKATGFSKSACLTGMLELEQLGVCDYDNGTGNDAHAIILKDEFHELLAPGVKSSVGCVAEVGAE